jgi:uncharacterized repeat protein (TIGR02543 family)
MKKIVVILLGLSIAFALIACKKEQLIEYQVDFVTNGGSDIQSVTVEAGSKINEPSTSKEGSTLVGWYLEQTFITRWVFNTDVVNQNLTLYAKWQEDVEPDMSIQEHVQSLLGTSFTNQEVTSAFGLSNPQNVGVVESEIVEVYEEIADSLFEENAIFNFETIKNREALSDTATWDFVLNQAKTINEENSQPVKIKLPNRTINIVAGQSETAISNYSIGISGFDGIHLVGGNDTVLMIETPTVWKGGLIIQDTKNIQINSMAIDYKYAPVLTGIIRSYDLENLTITMDIPQSMKEAVSHFKAVPDLASQLFSFVEYNMFTGSPKENGNVLIRAQGIFKEVTIIENPGDTLDQIIVTFSEGYRNAFKIPRTNDRVALGFAMYGNNGIAINQSEDILLENVSIHTAPGMGLTAHNVHNLFVNRLNITLKDDRLMTVTADGVHIANSTGRVEVTNSLIENTHDDALNIKSGYYYALSNVDAVARTIVLAVKTETMPLPKVGDVIHIYGESAFDLRAKLTVQEVSGTSSIMEIKVAERLSGTVDWTNAVATNVSFSAEFLFSNNIVRNKRNRGILVQVRDAVIENNTFENVGHGSIQVASSLDIFNEATIPDNILIQNNKFMNNGYLLQEALRGDISVFAIARGGQVAPSGTIQNVSIVNNFIANTANTGISLRGVGGNTVFVENNLIYNAARVFSSNLTEAAIELVNVQGISIINNYNYNTIGSLTFSGIIPAGLTKTDSIVLEGNVNLSFQTADGEVLTFNVGFLNDDAITIDGQVDEWVGLGTDIVIDGSSLATGDEISKSTYQNVFHVKMAKMAYSDTGIYFAFDIFDDTLEFKTVHDFWTGDVVEIFLSTYLEASNADFMLYKEEADVFQLALAPTWASQFWFAQSRTNTNIINNKNEVETALIITDEGWAGEVFIPFTLVPNVKTMIDAGEGIAIAFVFADSERVDINRTRLQVGNVPHFVEAYKTKTARMPRYIFTNGE